MEYLSASYDWNNAVDNPTGRLKFAGDNEIVPPVTIVLIFDCAVKVSNELSRFTEETLLFGSIEYKCPDCSFSIDGDIIENGVEISLLLIPPSQTPATVDTPVMVMLRPSSETSVTLLKVDVVNPALEYLIILPTFISVKSFPAAVTVAIPESIALIETTSPLENPCTLCGYRILSAVNDVLSPVSVDD